MMIPCVSFADLPAIHTFGRGVTVCARNDIRLATVLARKAKHEAVARRVREHFHIELPRAPLRASANAVAFAGTSPGAWLASYDKGDNTFATSLKQILGDLASVSEQSDGYAVLRLAGPEVRGTLARLVPVDTHATAFPTGRVAVTVAAHIGMVLWRLDDDAEGSPVFEIAVPRSFATSFARALSQTHPPGAYDLGR
jgi:methylglutamate dehydrogenase subunit D